MKHYDYIIAGAGCAGLSLLMRMVASGAFQEKKILLVDKAPKTENDRTWCFWEDEAGFFEPVVYKQWSRLHFHSHNHSRVMDIRPFSYKMIRAIDFYTYCFNSLEDSGVDILYEEIVSISSSDDLAYLETTTSAFSADYVFSSIMPESLERQAGHQYLLQHFKGWRIRTEEECFIPECATLMDFRIAQEHGASFVYILPFSRNEAMLEYTVFSEALLPDQDYTEALEAYMQAHYPDVRYTIESEERGKIPMTNHKFPSSDKRIIYLGTAGGATKPSSGYTFKFIQVHSENLIKTILSTGKPVLKAKGFDRFLWYDSILLRVLSEDDAPPADIFDRLFCRNTPVQVLRFLDNSTTLYEELRIISTIPRMPFIKAAVKELIHHAL